MNRQSLVVAALVTLTIGCDPRRVLRTAIHAERISDNCIGKAFERSTNWYLKRTSDGSMIVYSRPTRGKVDSFNLRREDIAGRATLQIEAAMLTGMANEPARLREFESAERSVAMEIVAQFAPTATLSCWDSKTQIEASRCLP